MVEEPILPFIGPFIIYLVQGRHSEEIVGKTDRQTEETHTCRWVDTDLRYLHIFGVNNTLYDIIMSLLEILIMLA